MSIARPVLFVDRDGTLIEEPADFQVDAYDKLRLVEGVIPALLRLRDAGWDFVLVSNQDGLGTDSFPQADFDGPHELLLQILASQGITFRAQLIDGTRPEDNAPTRKPGTAMFTDLLKDRTIDWDRSVVVGDRETDAQLAANLGLTAYLVPSRATEETTDTLDWAEIAHRLVDRPRIATVQRDTSETQIRVEVDLDKPGTIELSSGVGFLDHMLDQLAKHGGFSLKVHCDGDLHIDEHHTIEDVALALGQALDQALGDKRGIGRYGFTLPMDEAHAQAALDFSGRPYLKFESTFDRERVGDFPTEMVEHFWRSLCESARLNLHLSVTGDNAHHVIESGFKAVARAMRQALRVEGAELPSTKGVL
ncbi:bifunctional histidinol-phosphatase/imidazoleglycerol-phosphate dehydratase HisB [Ornithinicoccus hortensis]|uniref:Histidine biosynthesis bifunctional protein HisB n=1 Tax=Ornithinicoccus hortensis TaxID=82346 RepID=A0A542YTB7_9MICO|nr:bifunctional histidinol-phosphatase/imidazoleglycerol-phosphate dehydratase HisB [Ornithinicoccus hortensis]TQL51297.1 imidazoleglycerol-phosphate dehydratase [Ornithinicoccus hortensis]